MTKPVNLMIFLNMIEKKLGTDDLISMGVTYTQIINLLDFSFDEGLIIEDESKSVILSACGREKLKDLKARIYNNPSISLLPLEKYRTEKIGEFDVYLPKRKID